MSKVQRVSGKIVGFLPSSIKKIPAPRAIQTLYKQTSFSIVVKPRIGIPFRLQMHHQDAMNLAITEQKLDIPIEHNSAIEAKYTLKDNARVLTNVLTINGKSVPKIQAHGNVSKETNGEDSSGSSSSSGPSASTSSESMASQTARSESSASQEPAGSSTSDETYSASSNSESTERTSLGSVSYHHLVKPAESPVTIQKEYDALSTKPESAVEPGLKKIFAEEGWKSFSVKLGQHAGQSFDEAIKNSPTKTEIRMALENENIPNKVNRTSHKKRKPKLHLHDKQVF